MPLVAGVMVLLIGAPILFLAVWLEWIEPRKTEQHRKDRWESQVADLKAGKTTAIQIGDVKLFVEFVQKQPNVAAKVTDVVIQTLGPRPGAVADEQFGNCLKQLPHLESISFDETCDDVTPLLVRLAGKKSITTLSFYMTYLTDEGVRAVADFPNLKDLQVDAHWNDLNWQPLRSHKGLESLVWEDAKITEERTKILASWPRLKSLTIEIPDADFQKLKKSLPHVKEMGNSMR